MKRFTSILTGAALAVAGIVGLTGFAQAEEGVLRVIAFEGYADDDWIDQFEEMYDAEVRVTFVGAVDELFAKMSGSKGEDYDVLSIDTSLFPRYNAAGLLQPIDTGMAGSALLPAFALETLGALHVDGKPMGVPFGWGSIGMIYDTEEFGDNPPTSWEVMWDPMYKGRITILDDANNNITNAAIILGLPDPFNLSDAEMEQVKVKMLSLQDNILTYFAGLEEGVSAWEQNDIVLMFAMGEYQELEMLRRDLPVKYIIPDEGAIGWLDTWAISAGAGDLDLTYKWLNFFVSERVLGEMTERLGFGNTVLPAPGFDYADQLVYLQPPEDFENRVKVYNEIRAAMMQ
jgi:putative spermidine/putrescine transport system substrate-binding protein